MRRQDRRVPRAASGAVRVAMTAALLATTLAGCVVYREPAPVYHEQPVKVPPGHLPPPGQCRIWYPGTPPGHQPPPGPCHVLRHQVPAGAILVQG
jgi:hypothetical protein